jgi:hypothetical protein
MGQGAMGAVSRWTSCACLCIVEALLRSSLALEHS